MASRLPAVSRGLLVEIDNQPEMAMLKNSGAASLQRSSYHLSRFP